MPPNAAETLVIRSYRSVFRFERRLYRLDRWRIPLPGGVPLRALLYGPVVYAALLAAGRVPLLGAALAALAPPVHWGLAPLALVVAAVRWQLDGRPAHRALLSLARWALAPRWLAGLRRCPPPHGAVALAGVMVVRPDAGAPAYRPGRVRGPALVRLAAPAPLARTRSPRRLALAAGEAAPRADDPAAAPGAARLLRIPAGAELVIR